jgi:hypothetical protein
VGAVSLSHVAIEQLDCVVDGAAGRAMMAYGERQQSSERKAVAEELERAASRLQIRLRIAGRAVLLLLRLREAGVDVVDDEPLPGYDRVFTTDPFGNRLELMEPLR